MAGFQVTTIGRIWVTAEESIFSTSQMSWPPLWAYRMEDIFSGKAVGFRNAHVSLWAVA